MCVYLSVHAAYFVSLLIIQMCRYVAKNEQAPFSDLLYDG